MTDESALSAQASMQGELWGLPGAWAGLLESQENPLFEATMDALEPLAGSQLVDVGCGSGQALAIAEARGALVSGLDASEPLLDVAGSRLPGADLRVGDLEALPYDSGAFDRVAVFNSIQYAATPDVAMAELARICRPRGEGCCRRQGRLSTSESRSVVCPIALTYLSSARYGGATRYQRTGRCRIADGGTRCLVGLIEGESFCR